MRGGDFPISLSSYEKKKKRVAEVCSVSTLDVSFITPEHFVNEHNFFLVPSTPRCRHRGCSCSCLSGDVGVSSGFYEHRCSCPSPRPRARQFVPSVVTLSCFHRPVFFISSFAWIFLRRAHTRTHSHTLLDADARRRSAPLPRRRHTPFLDPFLRVLSKTLFHFFRRRQASLTFRSAPVVIPRSASASLISALFLSLRPDRFSFSPAFVGCHCRPIEQ